MVLRLVTALALAFHAGLHVSFFMPEWQAEINGRLPFDLTQSSLLGSSLDATVLAAIGTVIVVIAIVGLLAGAAAALGLVPWHYGVMALAVGATASIVSIVVFFHPTLIIGVLADLVILAGVAISRWLPAALEA